MPEYFFFDLFHNTSEKKALPELRFLFLSCVTLKSLKRFKKKKFAIER